MLMQMFMPDERIPSVLNLNLTRLQSLGIEGIIYDLDNTLGEWGFTEFRPTFLEHLDIAQTMGFKLAYISNDAGTDRGELIQRLNGAPVIFNARKPSKRNFIKILSTFALLPHQVAMVGDQIFTDVWGAKRAGLYTIMVDPVAPDPDDLLIKTKRIMERFVLGLGKSI